MCNGEKMDLGIRPCWFKSHLCHLLGRWYWENELTLLSFGSFICEMRMTTPTLQGALKIKRGQVCSSFNMVAWQRVGTQEMLASLGVLSPQPSQGLKQMGDVVSTPFWWVC